MKKKILTLFLALVMLVSTLCIGSVNASAEDVTNGTPISTVQEFKDMTAGGEYYLTADIDFVGEVFSDYIVQIFYGTLHGNGHSLLDFSISTTNSATATQYAGVFGNLFGGATVIENLNIGSADAPVSFTVNATNTTRDSRYYGVLAGQIQSSSTSGTIVNNTADIDNVNVYADITTTATASQGCSIGGFIGYIGNATCTFDGCTFNGSMNIGAGISPVKGRFVGGIVARMAGSYVKVITSCTNNAEISISNRKAGALVYNNDYFVGGICGFATTAVDIYTSTNNGDISTYLDDLSVAAGDSTFIAGILGGSNGQNNEIVGCVNNGTLMCDKYVSPFVGVVRNYAGEVIVKNNVNCGIYQKSGNVNSLTIAYVLGDKPTCTVENNVDHTVALIGSQTRANTLTTDVRFVFALNSVDYKSAGFIITATYGTNESKRIDGTTNTVYQSIYSDIGLGMENLVTAESLNCGYIYLCTLKNIPSDISVSFEITPVAVDLNNTTITGETYTVSYVAGQIQ